VMETEEVQLRQVHKPSSCAVPSGGGGGIYGRRKMTPREETVQVLAPLAHLRRRGARGGSELERPKGGRGVGEKGTRFERFEKSAYSKPAGALLQPASSSS
jgi:hypothetical protein